MNQAELNNMLEEHYLAISTDGKRGTKANFTGAVINGLNLSNQDLRGVSFNLASASGVTFDGSDLRGAKFLHSTLVQSTFCETNLQGSSFINSNISECVLTGANLKDATFVNNVILQTNLIIIHASKHTVVYHEGMVQVGCKYHGIKYWLRNHKKIGSAFGYTEDQVAEYKQIFAFLKKISTIRLDT